MGYAILGIFGNRYCFSGTVTYHLAGLVPPLWHLGGPLTIVGLVGAQGRTLWVSAPHFEAFRALWTRKLYFAMLISMFLFLISFGSESGFLGFEKQACVIRSVAKNKFHRSWISYDSRLVFLWFRVAFELIFIAFAALETGLNFDDFQGDSGVPPLATILVGCKLVGSWALATPIPGSLNPIQEILRPRLGVLRLRWEYIGYMTHWKRDYKRRSLLAPDKEGPPDILINLHAYILKAPPAAAGPFQVTAVAQNQAGYMGSRNQTFGDLGRFWDPIWKLFQYRVLNSFFSSLLQNLFVTAWCAEIQNVWGLQTHVFVKQVW